MSEWAYVWVAFGLTWVTLAGYGVYLHNRTRQAREALAAAANIAEVGE